MDITVNKSDLEKILDALVNAEDFFVARDKMNGHIHQARETRYSPITSTTAAARERLEKILKGQ